MFKVVSAVICNGLVQCVMHRLSFLAKSEAKNKWFSFDASDACNCAHS